MINLINFARAEKKLPHQQCEGTIAWFILELKQPALLYETTKLLSMCDWNADAAPLLHLLPKTRWCINKEINAYTYS